MPSSALNKLLLEFLEDLELGHGRSPRTIAAYDHYLSRFFKQQNIGSVADITQDKIREFRRHLNEQVQGGLNIATQNYHFIAIRQFLKYLAKRDIDALSSDKISLAKVAERDIDVLYPEEIDALLAAPKAASLDTLRDKAILETLFSTGVRVAELIRLDRDDIRDASNEIAVRGKGNKVRVVFLSGSAKAALGAYITARQDMDPALFVRHTRAKVDSPDDLRLTTRSVQRLMKKYAALAGLTKKITPHTLRHSFATDLLSNGADVREVQQLLGHASITTTQVYTHLTDVHLRDVHEKYHKKVSP